MVSVTAQLLIVMTKVITWIINATLLARQVIRLPHSDIQYAVKLNWFFCFFSRIHNIQLPSIYFSRHFLPEDQQPTPQICGLHWGSRTDIWSVVKQLQKKMANCIFSVYLGNFSGGFRLDCGSRQLHSYCHHVEVERLRRAGLPLRNVRAWPKNGKNSDKFQSASLQSGLFFLTNLKKQWQWFFLLSHF